LRKFGGASWLLDLDRTWPGRTLEEVHDLAHAADDDHQPAA